MRYKPNGKEIIELALESKQLADSHCAKFSLLARIQFFAACESNVALP